MGLLDRFKKKNEQEAVKQTAPEKAAPRQAEKKSVQKVTPVTTVAVDAKTAAPTKVKAESKGAAVGRYGVLIKPLITEKATFLNAQNQYLFAIDIRMNKVEVKKAIRTMYKVDPVSVNIIRSGGKQVRFGRVRGQRKAWKKAIVTLKPGDKIQVYEGV